MKAIRFVFALLAVSVAAACSADGVTGLDTSEPSYDGVMGSPTYGDPGQDGGGNP